MRRFPFTFATVAATALRAPAQAPPSTAVWEVANTTLAVPAAFASGPASPFWNPAAAPGGSLSAGLQLVQTPDVLGLSGVLFGAAYRPTPRLGLGAHVARMQFRDLVRTTTSPSSEPGGIAIHDQLASVVGTYDLDWLRIGAALRLHDSQFDALSEQGVTADMGMWTRPLERLRLAFATHFLPIDLSRQTTTVYYAAAEYDVVKASGTEHTGTVTARYGLAAHTSGETDHMVGLGAHLDSVLFLDLALTREGGFGDPILRLAAGLGLRLGRYALSVSRGAGARDIGAAYRVGLDVWLVP